MSTNQSPIMGACVSWDEVYPVIHLEAVACAHSQELTAFPVDLVARYAELYPAWTQLQRDLKRYLREQYEAEKQQS